MYLLQFERMIRSETGEDGFALPYWDYPDAPGIVVPPQFEDVDSPLFDNSRFVRPREIAPETWRDSGTFVVFGGGSRTTPAHRGELPGTVELNPHNPVHGFVGGDMAGFQSPLDALFWIDHCNVDRLWEVWLRLGRSNPPEASWSGTSFDFPDPDSPDGRRTLTIEDVATTAAAGYSYDDLPPDPSPGEGAGILADVGDGGQPRKDDDLELLGASAGGGSVTDGRDPVRTPGARQRLALLADNESSPPLFLRLENVGIDAGDASAMWNVYVRAGQGERHLAGTISPFGLAGLTASGGRQTITMDISRLSDELLGAVDAPLEVTFEPVYGDVEGAPFWEGPRCTPPRSSRSVSALHAGSVRPPARRHATRSPKVAISIVAAVLVGVLILHGHGGASPSSVLLPHATADGAAMMAAMMMVLAAPSAEVVAQSSLRVRRKRAVAGHVAGFTVVWFRVRWLVAVAVASLLTWVTDLAVAVAILATTATAWQLSGTRGRYVDRCSRVRTAPPRAGEQTWVRPSAECTRPCAASPPAGRRCSSGGGTAPVAMGA